MSDDWRNDPRFKLTAKEKAESIKEENDSNKTFSAIMGLIFMVVVGLLLYNYVVAPIFKSTSGFIENKADKKARCQTHYTVAEAKTEFAAKQAYKKCMDR
tara:strand:+ start:64 stop:363 length:300 start_codon:yes stop_codon:yes gene_type:complete